jgi:phytoene dehydrogenase-like protein
MTTKPAPQSEKNEIEEYFKRMEQAKAPAWMPDPGTTIVGEVIGLHMRDGEHGLYPCVTYRVEGGTVINVHAFHTLLRKNLADLKTDIGVKQIITYNGKRKKLHATEEEVKKGLDAYHDYYVENYGEGSAVVGKSEDFAF